MTTVDYSVQYIPQRSLPDKAIDLTLDADSCSLGGSSSNRCAYSGDISEEKARKQEAAAAKEDYKQLRENWK